MSRSPLLRFLRALQRVPDAYHHRVRASLHRPPHLHEPTPTRLPRRRPTGAPRNGCPTPSPPRLAAPVRGGANCLDRPRPLGLGRAEGAARAKGCRRAVPRPVESLPLFRCPTEPHWRPPVLLAEQGQREGRINFAAHGVVDRATNAGWGETGRRGGGWTEKRGRGEAAEERAGACCP
ncbi:unnamed protein product [Urochloa humidicola]